MLPCFLLSIFVLANLFIWTYLPQVAFLAIFHGPAAWLNGTFLVLGEGAAIVALLFEAFFVDESQVDMFDAVLVEKGFEDLVATTRPVNPDAPNSLKRLGKPRRSSVYAPFSLRQIVEFIILLPLNFIPIAGVPLFLLLTGYRAGPFHHWRYYKLLGLNKKGRNAFIRKRRWQYMWYAGLRAVILYMANYHRFGTVSLMLQLVPVLSMFFLLTTATGAALWAAGLEEERRTADASSTQPPEYADDPA